MTVQEVFVCCAPADLAAAEPLIAALNQVDAVAVVVELCEAAELPDACAAAADAAGVVLLLSGESVPAQSIRQLWQPVLERIEHLPATVASVLLEECPYPSSLKTRGLFVHSVDAQRALQRWAIALAPVPHRFEVVGFDDQYDYRDVIWIPCAARDRDSIQEDLAAALDGRRVLIVLDRCPADLQVPASTRERVVRNNPEPGPATGPLPASVAACYPDYLHRDFCAQLAGVPASTLETLLSPVTRDCRILRVPAEALRDLEFANAPRRRHAELLYRHLTARNAIDHAQLVRLELPAALNFCFAADWNFGASLAWRAREVLQDRWPGDTVRILLRLRQSALDHQVRSWVDLCEQELRWMEVDIPAARSVKGKAKTQQLTLDW